VAQSTVASGKAEILASGSVITFRSEPLRIRFAGLALVLKFQTDDKKKGTRMHGHADGKELQLTLTNFNSPLGSGTSEPIRIGTLGGKNLYLNFRVYALNNAADKTVHYTIYALDEKSSESVESA